MDPMMTSLQGLGSFLAYFGAAVLAEAVFLALYMRVTPHDEAKLIGAGNAAAAISLGGAMLGFTLPVASAVANSISILDMAVWTVVALAIQLAVFLLASLAMRGLSRRIEAGDTAGGITLPAAALSIGILNAACMTY